ncbi:MAG: leucine-rich repeat domain-containing protein [Anaerolineae bacterium]|nr:leucine-rich repeat domain-containing protein [Anaerolineae bacterium]
MERDELLKLIDRAAREGWTELDLGDQDLTELPPEIGQLTQLQGLNLRRNKLVDLPPEINQLTQLQILYLGDNQLTTLPPEIGQLAALQELELSHNSLTALPPGIVQLTILQSLDLRYNQLPAIPKEINQLTTLQKLNLGANELSIFPSGISQLTNLQYLDIGDNNLTTLPSEINRLTALKFLNLGRNFLMVLPPEINQLTALTELDLSENKISVFPLELCQLASLYKLDFNSNPLTIIPSEIGQLVDLGVLDFAGFKTRILPKHLDRSYAACRLTTLPSSIGQLTNLHYFDLRGTPIPLPKEILKIYWDAQTIIRAWLDYLAGQKRPLNEVKLVLVGEGSVGKTSLVNQLLYDTFDPNSDKTEGIAIHRWEVGGQQESEPLTQPPNHPTTQPSPIRVNVWDFGGQEIMHATHQFFLTRRTLYILALDSRYSEAENRLDYWLTLIRSFGGDSPILVVGNKTDQHPLDLDRRGLLARHPTVQVIHETSCATGAGIPELRAVIAQQIAAMPHVADPLVTTWFDVKAELEETVTDYISYRRYVELCREKNVEHPDSQRVLLGFLHDLGVVLHFPVPRLDDTISNPEWVTQGVYRILNTRLPFEEQGILTWDMLARILDDEPYQGKRMFIVDMMQKFELCYELPDRKDTFLIPDLQPKEETDTGAWDDALRFEVHYPVLPGSILTRLIVRMHRHIQDRTAWRTGVLLACDGNEALVKADMTANHVTIAVRGPGSGCRELLTRIREHLEAIHAGLAGLQPAEKIPVPGHPEIPPVDYKWLRDMERKGVPKFYPPGLTEPISVRQLLDGVEPPEARRERELRGGDVYYISRSQIGVAGRDADVDDGIHFDRSK